MAKLSGKAKFEVINEVHAPKFGESMVDILDITGKNTDFSKYPLNQDKTRYFKDKKGVFREMKEKLKKGQKVIAE
jgi:hypothetical protein